MAVIFKEIPGGVTAPSGFKAAGIHCGIKARSLKKDLMLIVSEKTCAAAGVYTKNIVKAAPILLTMEHLKDGRAAAIIANSGNANACAENDKENAKKMALLASRGLNVPLEDVAVASTGIIGQPLDIGAIERGMPSLLAGLGNNSSDAAEAIMTTDTYKKETALEYTLNGKTIRMGGICKGSGMIHPNMGTMLSFIATDAAISPHMLQKALREAVRVTFNRISVDGDTSTNDTCIILANGMSGTGEITSEDEGYYKFLDALKALCTRLARLIAADGEGASKLITCRVTGAPDEAAAEAAGKAVIASSLVKAAMFGSDANWGRVICAIGYSGTDFDPVGISISFSSGAGKLPVCSRGRGLSFDEDLAKKILSEKEIIIDVDMNMGSASAVCWGCDLTYDYVKINGDYRT
ncbi:MAG: bifunctional glutamate N-acetyltransferase/amino-acid acetyltransferase ArgJ [Clostridiales bacterium]|nr:bifunctional glutamate N-acetyltransferase/amino-acid acetyltransferase ArgJ [Clostridiales bacterium]